METQKVTMLRYRGSKVAKVKELDIFPKVKETYKEPTAVGGSCKCEIFKGIYNFMLSLAYCFKLYICNIFPVSIVTFILMAWLVYCEISYYLDSNFVFKFSPDIYFDEKLKINVDITVAMPCHSTQTIYNYNKG